MHVWTCGLEICFPHEQVMFLVMMGKRSMPRHLLRATTKSWLGMACCGMVGMASRKARAPGSVRDTSLM